MQIECEFCNGKVERSNREEHEALCEKRPLKCAAPVCEFQSADREAFANHIVSVHREQLIRKYTRLFPELTREEGVRPSAVERTDPPMLSPPFITRLVTRQIQPASSLQGLFRAIDLLDALHVAEGVHEYALQIIFSAFE